MRICYLLLSVCVLILLPLRPAAGSEGHALIVHGGYRDDDGWRERYAEAARRVRQSLVHMGVVSDPDPGRNRLWVLSPNNALATVDAEYSVDGRPSISNIRNLLKNRIAAALNADPEPFYLVIIGPASPGVVHLHDGLGNRDDLTAPELRNLMAEFRDTLQKAKGGLGASAYKVVVVGSPFAASIAPNLSTESNISYFSHWISIAASGSAQPAYAGPIVEGIEGIGEGCFFTAELFRSLARTDQLATNQSSDLLKAFSRASRATIAISRGWRQDQLSAEDLEKGLPPKERTRAQQIPVISLGESAGGGNPAGDYTTGVGGIFSFPQFDNTNGDTFKPLLANLQVHDLIRGIDSFSGEDTDTTTPVLRARIPVDRDNYYTSEFLGDSFVVAFARPWNRPQPAMSTWTRYHLEPDFYGYVMSEEAKGPSVFKLGELNYGYDYKLIKYVDLKDSLDFPFADQGFDEDGLWQVMARVYRKIEDGEYGYDGLNPGKNPYEVASTLATGSLLNGVKVGQGVGIGNFIAFSEDGQEGGHNPIAGTNQTIDIARPIRFGWDSNKSWYDTSKKQHEIWYSLAAYAPNGPGDAEQLLFTRTFNMGIPGGVIDRGILRQLLRANLSPMGVVFQVRAMGNNATWQIPSNDSGNGFGFSVDELGSESQHNENAKNNPTRWDVKPK